MIELELCRFQEKSKLNSYTITQSSCKSNNVSLIAWFKLTSNLTHVVEHRLDPFSNFFNYFFAVSAIMIEYNVSTVNMTEKFKLKILFHYGCTQLSKQFNVVGTLLRHHKLNQKLLVDWIFRGTLAIKLVNFIFSEVETLFRFLIKAWTFLFQMVKDIFQWLTQHDVQVLGVHFISD